MIPWLRKRSDSEFHTVYRLCGAGTMLAGLLVLSESGDLWCKRSIAHLLQVSFQVAGLLLGGAVAFHGVRLGRGILANLGALGLVVFLYARPHAWFWDSLPKYLFFLLIALVFLALVLVFRQIRLRMAERAAL